MRPTLPSRRSRSASAADRSTARSRRTSSRSRGAEQVIDNLARLVNDDPAIVRWGRHMHETFMVEVGDQQYLIKVSDGKIAVEKGPFTMRSRRFAIRANREAWGKFWQKTPDPGWH